MKWNRSQQPCQQRKKAKNKSGVEEEIRENQSVTRWLLHMVVWCNPGSETPCPFHCRKLMKLTQKCICPASYNPPSVSATFPLPGTMLNQTDFRSALAGSFCALVCINVELLILNPNRCLSCCFSLWKPVCENASIHSHGDNILSGRSQKPFPPCFAAEQ